MLLENGDKVQGTYFSKKTKSEEKNIFSNLAFFRGQNEEKEKILKCWS